MPKRVRVLPANVPSRFLRALRHRVPGPFDICQYEAWGLFEFERAVLCTPTGVFTVCRSRKGSGRSSSHSWAVGRIYTRAEAAFVLRSILERDRGMKGGVELNREVAEFLDQHPRYASADEDRLPRY